MRSRDSYFLIARGLTVCELLFAKYSSVKFLRSLHTSTTRSLLFPVLRSWKAH